MHSFFILGDPENCTIVIPGEGGKIIFLHLKKKLRHCPYTRSNAIASSRVYLSP